DEHSGDFKSGKHTDSDNPGKGKRWDYSSYDGTSYNVRLDYQLNERNKLNFAYQGYDNKAEYPGSLSWPGKSWGNDKLNSYDLSWDSQYSDKLQAVFRVYHDNIHFYAGNRDDNYDDNDTRVRVNGAEYQLNAILNENHLLTGGLEYRRVESGSSYIGSDEKKNDNKAIYLQDQWKISPKLTLTPGVRYDKHEEYGSYTSPKLVANYQADEKTNFYASWGKFFIAPNFLQLYCNYGGTVGNPNLKPEKGHSWEIGVNHQFDKTTLGRLNYFDRRTEDKINWIMTNPMTWAGTYENVDKEKARGLEIEIKKQYSEELSASLAYNWLDVKNSNNGSAYERDYNVPRNSWKIALDYEKDRVKAGIAGRFLKDRRGKYNAFPEKTYWVWDADVNYQINSDISAYLIVKNILDQYYQEYSNYPAAGRTLLFGLQYSF
ncbi:MAG: TonB-dependent receptor plug domain-containing protein, partial [bacterium]